MIQDYFIKNKVAIRFDTEEQCEYIHKVFNHDYATLIKQGLVSFTEQKLSMGVCSYTICSIEVLYIFSDHIIVSFEEFKELTNETKSILDGN